MSLASDILAKIDRLMREINKLEDEISSLSWYQWIKYIKLVFKLRNALARYREADNEWFKVYGKKRN